VAAARESTTGSSSHCDEELKSEYPFLDILHKPCIGFWPYTLQSYSVGEREIKPFKIVHNFVGLMLILRGIIRL